MIHTLLIEDEEPAATRLARLLKELDSEMEIVAVVDTVDSAVKWLENHKQPDLIMLDIQLGDGQSFEIFRKVKVDSYVIFTTAYDEFALKAFEMNSIDYLLKPIDKSKLQNSLAKFRKYKNDSSSEGLTRLIESIENRKNNFKKRFVVTIANRIRVIDINEVAFFRSSEKNTFITTTDNHNYPVEFSLDNIELVVDPASFFRINRQYLVCYRNIIRIDLLSKSRIKITTDPPAPEELLVSSSRTPDFRNWLDR